MVVAASAVSGNFVVPQVVGLPGRGADEVTVRLRSPSRRAARPRHPHLGAHAACACGTDPSRRGALPHPSPRVVHSLASNSEASRRARRWFTATLPRSSRSTGAVPASTPSRPVTIFRTSPRIPTDLAIGPMDVRPTIRSPTRGKCPVAGTSPADGFRVATPHHAACTRRLPPESLPISRTDFPAG